MGDGYQDPHAAWGWDRSRGHRSQGIASARSAAARYAASLETRLAWLDIRPGRADPGKWRVDQDNPGMSPRSYAAVLRMVADRINPA